MSFCVRIQVNQLELNASTHAGDCGHGSDYRCGYCYRRVGLTCYSRSLLDGHGYGYRFCGIVPTSRTSPVATAALQEGVVINMVRT